MSREHIEFEALEVIGKALAAYEGGVADFADTVIALRNGDMGAHVTYTFDEAGARSVTSMVLLA